MVIDRNNYKRVLSDLEIDNKSLNNLRVTLRFEVNGSFTEYEPAGNHLRCLDHDNDYIFRLLKVDPNTTCSQVYDTPICGGIFPSYEGRDKLMMNKMALYLFTLCEENNTPTKEISLNNISGESFLDKLETYQEEKKSSTSFFIKFDDLWI